jgi:hypothetical protein
MRGESSAPAVTFDRPGMLAWCHEYIEPGAKASIDD